MKTKLTILCLLSAILAACAQTVPQTQLILQSYFQTGQVPSSTNYMEFIGTMFYLYNASVSNAQAAAASAANLFKASGEFYLDHSASAVVIGGNNITSIVPFGASSGQSNHFAITFSNNVPSTNYTVFLGVTDWGSGLGGHEPGPLGDQGGISQLAFYGPYSNKVSGFSFDVVQLTAGCHITNKTIGFLVQ
jgi:hypothetical protein